MPLKHIFFLSLLIKKPKFLTKFFFHNQLTYRYLFHFFKFYLLFLPHFCFFSGMRVFFPHKYLKKDYYG